MKAVWLVFFLLWTLILPEAAQAMPIPQKKRLALGETIRLKLPAVERVRLSRDGIVIARHGSGDEWLLTGTAKGIVLIHPDGGVAGEREIVLEVFAPQSHPGSQRSIRTVQDPKDSLGCDGIASRFGAFEFRVSMDSRRLATEAGLAPRIEYTAQANVVSGGNSVSIGRGSFGVAARDISGRMDSNVIAKPRLVLFPGVEAAARSGGEFRIDAPVFAQASGNGNPNGVFPGRMDVWKEYGLAVRAKWTECVRESAVVEYEVSVTQRISGNEQHLLAGRISGKRAIMAGDRAFGGAVEFASGARSRQGSYLLRGIPILGPMLSKRDDENGETTMTVWVQALDDSTAGQGYLPSDRSEALEVDFGAGGDEGSGKPVE